MRTNKKLIITGVLALIIGLAAGALFLNGGGNGEIEEVHVHAGEEQVWTCAMHPQIRQAEPGQCPICGMDLIPVSGTGDDEAYPMAVRMSERAMALANVQTTVVGRGADAKELRLTGKVQEDERLVYNQTAHFPGRIEKLYINFTGERVNKGQKIATIYSPELVTAQEELFEAKRFGNEALVDAARRKLKLWRLSDQEIQAMESSDNLIMEVPVRAHVSGVVINKNVSVGSHVMEGTVLYEIADLSRVWVVFDAYESDLQWIEAGDKISFTVASLPGRTFESEITFVDPVINPKTRVAEVRTEVPNQEGLLKPEMLATAWIKADMPALKAGLAIPRSAVMWTGKRSVVYVKIPGEPAFMMREVVLGPALEDSYMVAEGLEAGEEVVTHGTFTIDAAAQLQGKKSMMNPEGGASGAGHMHDHGQTQATTPESMNMQAEEIPEAFKQQLTAVVNQYYKIKEALVASQPVEASKQARATLMALEKVDMGLLRGAAHDDWMGVLMPMQKGLSNMAEATALEPQRESFIAVSDHLANAARTFGVVNDTVYVQRCPMADSNRGANWLSNSREIRNPYFGEAMLTCGEVIHKIMPNQ